MKNKLGYLVMVFGVIIIISSIIKWFFLYHVNTYLVFGVSIGIIIFGSGYLYNWMKGTIRRLIMMQEQIDAIGAEMFNQVGEANREKALRIGQNGV